MTRRVGQAGASLRMHKDSFGPVLRAGRERRRVSLGDLCRETKVRPEIWEALEANDLSAWPTGIYARSLIRQYAERVDLHPNALVDEFCRLFPNGDRRAAPLLREFAAIVAHDLAYREAASTPTRRAGDTGLPPTWLEAARVRVTGDCVAMLDWTRRRITLVVEACRTRAWTGVRGA
jgi:hypothetical protein